MCGILGEYYADGRTVNRDAFNERRDTLSHRGPDFAQSWFSSGGNTALGQARLAIVDLDPRANQPLHSEDGTVHAVVNGEIYNYPLLRKELEEKGHVFSSASDSEIAVHGWEEWGRELPSKLEGMFALAVFDEKKQCLFACRDRFGIKPLYYMHRNGVFLFASELKAITGHPAFTKEIDRSSFADFFVYRYIPSPKTIWKEVSKLPPAHFLLVGKGIPELKEYWEMPFAENRYSQEDVVEAVDTMLLNSVQKHLMSDVPVGTFLSGGFDSSALAVMQHRLNYPARTFSMGFAGWDKSEHKYAGIVAARFGFEHKEELIDSPELNLLGTLAYHYDEPNGDISCIPTYLVSRLASKNVKVVFSGEGADEIFGGYTWHHQLMNKTSFLSREGLWRLKEGVKTSGLMGYAHAMAMGLFDKKKLSALLPSGGVSGIPDDPFWFYRQHYKADLHPLKAYQYLDIKTFMAELVLQKVDRASMAQSLEARVPFLDHKLVEFMFGLHPDVYYKKGVQKRILQQIIKPWLPTEILNRKKQGFTGPDVFYQNDNWYRKELAKPGLVAAGLIKPDFVEDALMKKDYWRLWKIVVMEKWFTRWG